MKQIECSFMLGAWEDLLNTRLGFSVDISRLHLLHILLLQKTFQSIAFMLMMRIHLLTTGYRIGAQWNEALEPSSISQTVICLCAYMCMFMCMQVHAHVWTCGSQPCVCVSLFGSHLPGFLRQGLSLRLGECSLAKLSVQWAPGILCLCLPSGGSLNTFYHIHLFTWVLGAELKSLCHVPCMIATELVCPIGVFNTKFYAFIEVIICLRSQDK